MNRSPEFEEILALLRVAQWSYDPGENALTWQQSFVSGPENSREYSTEAMEMVLERYAPQDRTNLLQHFETILKDGNSGPKRFAVFTRTGAPSFIESAGVRVKGDKGYPIICGIYRNCAADVEAEISFRDLNGLVDKLNSLSASAIMMTDALGTIRSVNSLFLKAFRLPADHGLVGRNLRTVPNRVGKTFVNMMVAALDMPSGQEATAARSFHLHDGGEIQLDYRIVRYGGRMGGFLFKANYKEETSVDMGALFDHLPTPMLAVSLQSRNLVAANAMARRYFGLRKETFTGEDITARLLKPADLRNIMTTINSVGIENGHVCQVNTLMGESQTYRIRALPYTDGDRKLLIMEFHAGAKKKTPKQAPAANDTRRGLLKRVVDHLDF